MLTKENIPVNTMTNTVSIRDAVMTIFNASCPQPIHYRTNTGIDTESFYADFQVWQPMISATWMTLTDTRHDDQCRCCINFRFLCTNCDNEFRETLGDDFTNRRVSKIEIKRWSEGISTASAQASFQSIKYIAKAMITNTEHSAVLDIPSDSEVYSELSETSRQSDSSTEQEAEDIEAFLVEQDRLEFSKTLNNELDTARIIEAEGSKAAVIDKGSKHNARSQHQEAAKLQNLTKTLNNDEETATNTKSRMKPMSRRSDQTIELATDGTDILIASIDLDKTIRIKNNGSSLEKLLISRFLQNLIPYLTSARQRYATFQMRSQRSQRSQASSWYKEYVKQRRLLLSIQDDRGPGFTTRQIKRQRQNGD